MYERFSDRARETMRQSNFYAQKLNHDYIGTEHLLMGLVLEGGGLASQFITKYISLDDLKSEIEKISKPSPEMITMGRLPQTPRLKKVIEYSMQYARNLNDNFVGTHHILMGLFKEKEGAAHLVFDEIFQDLSKVQNDFLDFLKGESNPHFCCLICDEPMSMWEGFAFQPNGGCEIQCISAFGSDHDDQQIRRGVICDSCVQKKMDSGRLQVGRFSKQEIEWVTK